VRRPEDHGLDARFLPEKRLANHVELDEITDLAEGPGTEQRRFLVQELGVVGPGPIHVGARQQHDLLHAEFHHVLEQRFEPNHVPGVVLGEIATRQMHTGCTSASTPFLNTSRAFLLRMSARGERRHRTVDEGLTDADHLAHTMARTRHLPRRPQAPMTTTAPSPRSVRRHRSKHSFRCESAPKGERGFSPKRFSATRYRRSRRRRSASVPRKAGDISWAAAARAGNEQLRYQRKHRQAERAGRPLRVAGLTYCSSAPIPQRHRRRLVSIARRMSGLFQLVAAHETARTPWGMRHELSHLSSRRVVGHADYLSHAAEHRRAGNVAIHFSTMARLADWRRRTSRS
jgi:hypothetical protein